MYSPSEVYRIYVCGISYDVTELDLEVNFECFGNICDISFEPFRHFAFISYTNQKDAILAIAKGHELNIGEFDIIVEWANGWPINRPRRKIFHKVFDETSLNNSTVYIKGLEVYNSREFIESIFSPFGMIEDIFIRDVWSDYALIRFREKWDACLAICTIDDIIVAGRPVSCTWSHRVEGTWPQSVAIRPFPIPIGGVPTQAHPLPPTLNTTIRTSAAASSATIRTPAAASSATIRTPAAALSATYQNAINPALSSSTSGTVSPKSNTTVRSAFSPECSALLRNIRAMTIGTRSENLTTPTTSSTSAISSFSGSSSSLGNNEHTNDDFDTVFNQTTRNNCTVCCKGLNYNTKNKSLKKIFSLFGIIEDVGYYFDRSDFCALIRFNTKEAATLAICSINNTEIDGRRVKCTWSKDNNFWNHQAQVASVRQPPSTISAQISSQAACIAFVPPPPPTAAVITKKGTEEKTSDIFCKICMDEELGVVFLPCGHLTACEKCAQQISTCPLCRKLITSKIRTYLG